MYNILDRAQRKIKYFKYIYAKHIKNILKKFVTYLYLNN